MEMYPPYGAVLFKRSYYVFFKMKIFCMGKCIYKQNYYQKLFFVNTFDTGNILKVQ